MDNSSLSGSIGTGPSFFLVPENSNARRVVKDPKNTPFVQFKDDTLSLYLDFSTLGNSTITLGRSGSTIYLPDHGAGISKVHCYFQCSPMTGAVILHDKSSNRTTHVYDQDMDFSVPMSQVEYSVVVTKQFNRRIAIGYGKHYRFRLVWESDGPVKDFLSMHPNQFGPEPCTPNNIRYIQGEILGFGNFGLVRRTVNVHTGKPMAVKRFFNLEGKRHVLAIREANNMSKLANSGSKKCEHILPILEIVYDKVNFQWLEIFMPLKEGSVRSLIEVVNRGMTDSDIAQSVLYQMAKALKFMAKNNLVHRDIKPDNILYETRYGHDGEISHYHFLLADFNLSNEAAQARTYVGTPIFMAPEVYDRQLQACTVDIWSLFVTVVWIYNFDGFRSYDASDGIELRDKITEIAQQDMFVAIRDMAEQDPSRRVSASSLLARLERSSSSLPQLSAAMSDMTLRADDDGSSYNYTTYISGDVAQGFANKFGSAGQQAGPSEMNGLSVLEEFSNAKTTVMSPNAYQNGLMDQHYQYASYLPRNGEFVLDAKVKFDEFKKGSAGDDEEEDEDAHGKGKETDNKATKQPYSYYS